MSDDILLTELSEGVQTITLNRPEARNALNQPLFVRLSEAILDAGDNPDVRCVLLRGANPSFCAGGDLGGKPPFDPSDLRNARQAREAGWPTAEMRSDRLTRFATAFHRLHTMGKPTLAAINGTAAGAGLALALACDLRIGAADCCLSTAFAKVGFSGDCGISYYLPLLAGHAKARELMLLGKRLGAEEALACNLLTCIAPANALDTAALDLARSLAGGPTVALRYIKRNLNAAETQHFAEVIEAEAVHMRMSSASPDHAEARRAFFEKRAPRFNGL